MNQRPRRRYGPLILAGVSALALAACAGDPGQERLEGTEAPPAAAMVSPTDAESLDRQLERLRLELAAGMEGDPDRLLQAEAITDGLMEARRPFDWLASGYDIEARLRQLQAMADRMVARLRRGAEIQHVDEDVESMVLALTDLRTQLAAGRGGPAPPSLDSLLAGILTDAPPGSRAAAAPAGVETPEISNEPDEPAATPAEDEDAGPLGRPIGN